MKEKSEFNQTKPDRSTEKNELKGNYAKQKFV